MGILHKLLSLAILSAHWSLAGAPMRDVMADYLSPNGAVAFYDLARSQTETLFKEWCGTFSVGGRQISMATNGSSLRVTVDGESTYIDLGGDDFTKLHKDFPICPFDIFMPFLSWDVAYDGPATLMGRRAQRYVATAPSAASGYPLEKVKIYIDAAYAYPLSWEAIDGNGHVLRKFRIRSLKKDAAGEWNVSSFEFFMPRERKSLHVKILD
ncbi:MAG: hypothetical protein LBI39_03640 [Puniceicoccales bacterium]|jgi:hypothetical protein|nr:hypothetical protein [Puniceicoccales bacterium]